LKKYAKEDREKKMAIGTSEGDGKSLMEEEEGEEEEEEEDNTTSKYPKLLDINAIDARINFKEVYGFNIVLT